MQALVRKLRQRGIQPTAQRVAIAEVLLATTAHPTAEDVLEMVRNTAPSVSRATVYNTLNLFTRKGLVETRVLRDGITVYDPNIEPHHHFIDDDTGEIVDLPEDVVEVVPRLYLEGIDIREIQVVIRGRRRMGDRPAADDLRERDSDGEGERAIPRSNPPSRKER